MRKNVYLGMLVLISAGMHAQEGSPIPCTTGEYNTLPQEMLDKQCILEVKDAHLHGDAAGMQFIKASERIVFKSPTTVHPVNGSMSFSIGERAGGLNLAWLEPAGTYQVPRYEKIELGVQIPVALQPEIDAFIAENPMGPNTVGLNPFDPDQIDVYAVFERETEPGSWAFERRINGFYFEDYERDFEQPGFNGSDFGQWDWSEVETEYKFRIRYTPKNVGRYRCIIYFEVPELNIVYSANQFEFDAVESSSKGFVIRSGDSKFFEFSNGEFFFPSGQNLHVTHKTTLISNNPNELSVLYCSGIQQTNPPQFPKWAPFAFSARTVGPALFLEHRCQLEQSAENGLKNVRTISMPWDYDIEYKRLNNYYDRMHGAWEFDKYVELAKDLGVKIEWNMQVHYPFEVDQGYNLYHWDWYDDYCPPCYEFCDNNGIVQNQGYAYHTVLGLSHPSDFFSDPEAIEIYKKKIRYNIARWGYSPDIFLIELLSEANQVGREVDDPSDCNGGQPSIKKTYNSDPVFRNNLFLWQKEIARYIKQDLGHDDHLLASSYLTGGTFGSDQLSISTGCNTSNSDILSDLTYFENQYLDVICESRYSPSINDHLGHSTRLNCFDKPFIFSEIGIGDGNFECARPVDNYTSYLLSCFSGSSGAGNSWDNYENLNRDHWTVYQHVSDFFDLHQIDFTEGIWLSNSYDLILNNVSVTTQMKLLYAPDEPCRVGVIYNKFYNPATIGTCNNEDGWPYSTDTPNGFQMATWNSPLHLNLPVNDCDEIYATFFTNPISGELEGMIGHMSENFTIDFQFPDLNISRPLLMFSTYKVGSGQDIPWLHELSGVVERYRYKINELHEDLETGFWKEEDIEKCGNSVYITVFNSLGSVVFEGVRDIKSIDNLNVESGVYFVKYLCQSVEVVRKLYILN